MGGGWRQSRWLGTFRKSEGKRLDLSLATRLGLCPARLRIRTLALVKRVRLALDAKGSLALPMGKPIRRLALFRNPAQGEKPSFSSVGWKTDSQRP